MNNDAYLKKRQALEALDYIDDDIISGVLGKIKSDCATVADTTRTWRTPLKYWKQFAALAACLILLSVASPMIVRFVSSGVEFLAGVVGGNETTVESSDNHYHLESNEETVENIDTTNAIVNTTDSITEGTVENEITWNPGPCYLDFEGLEPLTKEQMYEIRDEWAKNRYDRYYSMYYDHYSQQYDQETAIKMAEKEAQKAYDNQWNKVFNEYYYTLYGYYGIINECIILSFPGHELVYYIIGDFVCYAEGLYAYKDGEFYDIKEAYDMDLLSVEQIKKIYTRINQREDAIDRWKKGE